MSEFTPVTYIPRNLPALGGTWPSRNTVYNTSVDPSKDAIEPIMGLSDIAPDAVKRITGSDVAAIASGLFSPFSIVKKTPKANLTEGQDIYRAVRDPVEGRVSRRENYPEYEFGIHVTVDPQTARWIRDTNQYGPDILTMKSKVSKPIWVSDGEWDPKNLSERLVKENADKLSDKLAAAILKVGFDYDISRVQSLYSEQGAVMTKYAKKLQKLLMDNGYDHISYINMIEGAPVESAILFSNAAATAPKLTQ